MSGMEEALLTQQMDTPKPPIGIFKLPCGYLDVDTNELHDEIEVREITGHEEDMLASKQVKGEDKYSTLLSACITRIGTLTDKAKIKRAVMDLTTGDRMFAMFAIRRVTLGDETPIREVCQNKECKVSTLFVIDLNDLTVDYMEEPRKRVYDMKLPSGMAVRFRISTGHDEQTRTQVKARNKNDLASMVLMMRIEMLGDEPPTLATVKALSLRDRHALRKEMERVEGGVDLELEMECPVCGHEWKQDLAVGMSFLFPSET